MLLLLTVLKEEQKDAKQKPRSLQDPEVHHKNLSLQTERLEKTQEKARTQFRESVLLSITLKSKIIESEDEAAKLREEIADPMV